MRKKELKKPKKIHIMMKKAFLLIIGLLSAMVGRADDLRLNELGYFERQGVNVLVFSNSFNGGFNDEKNSGIEVIHHGVRTVQGGAVRLNNTPEQWALIFFAQEAAIGLSSS